MIIKKFLVLPIILMLILSFVLGFFVGENKANITISKLEEEKQQLQNALETIFPPLPTEIHSVFGKVVKIDKDYLEIEVPIRVARFPLPDGKEIQNKIIKVVINSETQMFQRKINNMPPNTTNRNVIIEPKENQPLSLSDIKVGDYINVISKDNIMKMTEVVATHIFK